MYRADRGARERAIGVRRRGAFPADGRGRAAAHLCREPAPGGRGAARQPARSRGSRVWSTGDRRA